MIMLMFGPQGSGKSTQAKLLATARGWLYVSTGTILREMYKAKIPGGLTAASFWMSGNLVPDDMMTEILQRWLKSKRPYQGLVLDGYPRTIEQAVSLNEELGLNDGVDLVIELRVSDEELYRRLINRANTEKRADETPEAIKRRLELYKDRTNPLLYYYQSKGIPVVKIDGERSVADIQQDILKKVEEEATHDHIQRE